jgi:hypothetical protein
MAMGFPRESTRCFSGARGCESLCFLDSKCNTAEVRAAFLPVVLSHDKKKKAAIYRGPVFTNSNYGSSDC